MKVIWNHSFSQKRLSEHQVCFPTSGLFELCWYTQKRCHCHDCNLQDPYLHPPYKCPPRFHNGLSWLMNGASHHMTSTSQGANTFHNTKSLRGGFSSFTSEKVIFEVTLQGINISHDFGKRKIIDLKCHFWGICDRSLEGSGQIGHLLRYSGVNMTQIFEVSPH